jgi:3-hydroxyisobutyrate dehydrogenase
MANISFLGTGAMGSRMAAVLIKAGYKLTVWNRTQGKADNLVKLGAVIASTPAESVSSADYIISMLRDDEASREVWLKSGTGALAATPDGAVVIESSTVTPGWARSLAAECAKRELPFVDAPVVGSRPQAEASQLIFLVGGDKAAFDTGEPLFKTMGKAAHYLGAAGNGAELKLIVNSLLAVQVAAIAELFGVIERSNIDTAAAVEALKSTPVCSPSAGVAADSMLKKNFAPLFTTALILKDINYLIGLSASIGADNPVVQAAKQVFGEAVKAGYEEEQMTSVVKLYSQTN